MGSARRLRSTTDAEVRRTGRIVVATGDPGRAPSGEAAASGKAMRACSAPPASRLAEPVPPGSTTGAIASARDAPLWLSPSERPTDGTERGCSDL